MREKVEIETDGKMDEVILISHLPRFIRTLGWTVVVVAVVEVPILVRSVTCI